LSDLGAESSYDPPPQEGRGGPLYRVISVLYADIVGSTEMVTRLEPEEAYSLLEPILAEMADAIHRFGGHVLRVEGDGIKAAFGSTASDEHHAAKACLSALEILSLPRVRRFGQYDFMMRIRIGIDSGRTLVRWQNTDFGSGLDTTGAPAHVASKIQATSPPDMACISGQTQTLVAPFFETEFHRKLVLGEGARPKDVFVLRRLHDWETTLARHGQPVRAPLAGRKKELGIFRSWLDAGLVTMPPLVALRAPAGVGKSRLAQEIASEAALRSIDAYTIPSVGITETRAFYTARNLSRLLSTKVPAVEQALHGSIGTSPEIHTTLSHLIAEDEQSLENWSIPEMQKSLLITNALKRLFRLASGHSSPILLCIEDAHSCDRDSLTCILSALPDDDSKLRLLLTTRPTDFADQVLGGHHVMDLAELGPEDSRDLAKAILSPLDGKADMDAIIDRITTQAGGLALGLVELCQLEVAGESEPSERSAVPMAIEPILRSRLERLPGEALQLAQVASVAGELATLGMCSRLLARDPTTILLQRSVLTASGVLKSRADNRLEFSHLLYEKAAYDSVPIDQRRDLHAKIHDDYTSEETPGPSIADQLLAHHASRAGRHGEALVHLRAAFKKANAAGAFRTVGQLYERADRICSKLPDSQLHRARFAMLAFDAAHRLTREGDLDETFRKALENHDNQLAQNEKILVRCNLGLIRWTAGRPAEGLDYAEQAAALVREAPHPSLSFYANYVAASCQFATGHVAEAVTRLVAQSALLSGDDSQRRWGQSISVPGIITRTFASWYATDHGDFDLAERLFREAEEIENAAPSLYGRFLCDMAATYRFMRTGNYESGVAQLSDTYWKAESVFRSLAPQAGAWLALCHLKLGDLAAARAVIKRERAANTIEHVRNSNRFYVESAHAELLLAEGKAAQALEYNRNALATARDNQDPVHEAYGLFQMHSFLTSLDLPDRTGPLERALALAQASGLRPLENACRTALSQTL
jgi:class 3 adenylate cyclase/tetratricopeptide (TPR) repeat protein